jgi:hypothetical protein
LHSQSDAVSHKPRSLVLPKLYFFLYANGKETVMLYGVEELLRQDISYLDKRDGRYHPARPSWVSCGRWRHAWWVLTGRCDAIWWPQDGNPYWENRTAVIK